jgi:RimJ/RimL family protein N-acetyltransferase
MVTIRHLTGKDAQQYHAFCQDARKRPGFFYEASPDEVPERWLEGLTADPNYFVLGAFGAGDELVGLTTLSRRTHRRWCHRASLHQIRAADDSEELLTSLLSATITLAKSLDGLHQLELEVVSDETRLFEVAQRVGFEHWGNHPAGVQLDGCFYDQSLMVLRLGGDKAVP